ncbi:MAG: iron-containing alcohol dehydrogenase [Gammaproteobacteria bacterium]|nr:iron-containing alcohol dehydrogenase [Gammaproteobacteria bacterium]
MTLIKPFTIARLPRIVFGSGVFGQTAEVVSRYGHHALLVTGKSSFRSSKQWPQFLDRLNAHKITVEQVSVEGEPSPQLVDDVVETFCKTGIDVVVGIGGGSAMDAAKAIAGLLNVRRSVMDYLEGVGQELPFKGPSVPFIAVPTTAGTGSEATKNAVLSRRGKHGFKKSFRDDRLVAEWAIVDPDLLSTCSPNVIAANGMDALTQLIESFVSTKSNVFNDSLGVSGLSAVRDGLIALYQSEGTNAQARERMAYASLVSGINLAQTGLGSVHGLASPLGGFYPIPHGVVCGTLVAEATEVNIKTMQAREPENPALARYARVAELLTRKQFDSLDESLDELVKILRHWTVVLGLSKLSQYGCRIEEMDLVVSQSRGGSMKTNPVILTDQEIKSILNTRIQ